MTSRANAILLAVAVLGLAATPFFAEKFYVQFFAKLLIMGILAMSLDLLIGYTGLVSFGHGAFYGAAAYTLAILTPQYQAANFWTSFPIAIGVSALLALVIGFFVVRTHGIYFIMVTLAFAQMLFFLFHDTKIAGGNDGIYIDVRPVAKIGDWQPFNLDNFVHVFYLVLLFFVLVYVLLRVILASPFGRVLVGIKANEARMRSLGFPTFRYKLVAFVIAGAIAGVAGYLSSIQFGVVNPEMMGWHLSGAVMMMVILGGMGTLTGPIIGAAVWMLLELGFQGLPKVGSVDLGKHWQLWMGSFIVLSSLLLPNGLLGLGATVLRRIRKQGGNPVPEVVLATQGLTRHFGGLAAVSGVSLEARMGQLHAVIGPNGAGKSTLINMLSGDLPPSSGSVAINGRDVTGMAAHQISRMGVGRSYQKTNVFLAFTAFENCRLAAQSRRKSSMRFFSPAVKLADVNSAADAALDAAGLRERAGTVASALSHGEQRQLEIAMTLATQPKLLLLDEPLAGMGAEESASMVALLKKLVATHAILLVEHDMDAVFALADRLTVMVNGQVLASGAPAEIRANAEVQEAYLGESHE